MPNVECRSVYPADPPLGPLRLFFRHPALPRQLKLKRVRNADVDVGVLQFYACFAVALSGFLVLAVEPFIFSKWGILGAVIWILANVHVGGASIAQHTADALGPLGHAIGLDGAVLLAYIIAIPANEIVVPTLMMIYLGTGMMTDVTSFEDLRHVLVDENGWTMLTAVNLMLFSLLHNPCATTILTIYKETLSARWATIGALMPLGLAFIVTFLVATVWRLVA